MSKKMKMAFLAALNLSGTIFVIYPTCSAQAGTLEDNFRTPPESALSEPPRINTAVGFSHTGDTEVKPEEAMKKLVWSVTHIKGGQLFNGKLTNPPENSGPFQNIPYRNESPWTHALDRSFYRDVTVFAYPRPTNSIAQVSAITSNAGEIPLVALTRQNPKQPFLLKATDEKAWLELKYDKPQSVRSITLATTEMRIDSPMIVEVFSDHLGNKQKIGVINLRSSVQTTISFAPVMTDKIRLEFSRQPLDVEPIVPLANTDVAVTPTAIDFFKMMRDPGSDYPIVNLVINAGAVINEFERKAGFFTYVDDYYKLDTGNLGSDKAISPHEVINLTDRLGPDGTLSWKAPAGEWNVVRMGYSLTGQYNHPAPPQLTGLEVDKLDADAMRRYMLRHLASAPVKTAKPNSVLFADSIESGPQNWTGEMLAQFKARRGYDPYPYLPALTGVVVGSAEASDKFLWDFRATIAELFHEATFKTISETGHAAGFHVAVEALESGRHNLGDDFEMRRWADFPMGALWASSPVVDYLKEFPNQVADIRGAASVAHIFGRRVIPVESATDLEHPGEFSPRTLKPIVDLEFALGVNALAEGPKPGDPWSPYAKDWLSYQARTSIMLQQGDPVVDVAYLYGEEAPLVALRGKISDTPLKNSFDFVSAPTFEETMSVADGKLVAPSGLKYSVLQLGGSSGRMTLGLLRKIEHFVSQGLVVIGDAPTESPSLSDSVSDFVQIRDRLWGANGAGGTIGKGRVIGKNNIDSALLDVGINPDLASLDVEIGRDILFQHRKVGGEEVYFIKSRLEKAKIVGISFRATGKAPELWRADTGSIVRIPYEIKNGRTLVSVDIGKDDAFFLVFRDSSTASEGMPKNEKVIASLDSKWSVSLDDGSPPIALSNGSWTEQLPSAARYFSGVATYRGIINVPAHEIKRSARFMLSLGEIRELAEVKINGKAAGVRLFSPYSVDISKFIKAGRNDLEIKVANLGANAMIGARQTDGKAQKKMPSGFNLVEFKSDAVPRLSGILGPVTIIRYDLER